MTLKEILDRADQYANALSTKQKVSIVNELQKKLFRTIYRIKTATSYDLVEGQFLYPLDFHPSKIISVVVDGKRYDYEDINKEESIPPYLYTYEDSFGLYPTPEKTVKGGLIFFHYKEPAELTAENLSAIPDFDPDFHMLLMYGLQVEMAEINEDVAMVNNFTAKYNGLLEEFKKSLPEPEAPTFIVE